MGTLLSTGQDRGALGEGRPAQGLGARDGNPLSIYTARCEGGDGIGIERILPAERTTFYAYGRQALAEGLRRVGLKAGDRVLMPGLICHEVLASVSAVGAAPSFYPVDANLQVEAGALERTVPDGVKAVIAVNYFGFPQPLTALRDWCRTHGAALIEDNAHGFLSADGDVPLGRRGDLGVFSLRKTLTLPNGAALVDNRKDAADEPGLRFDKSPTGSVRRYRFKAGLKQLMRVGGIGTARAIVCLVRASRQAATGTALPPPLPDAETAMPQEAFAPLTERLLARCDVEGECARRRSLYRWCAERLRKVADVRLLFPLLPEGVVPQGLPFLYTGRDLDSFKAAWWREGAPVLAWPDRLPSAVAAPVPVHYRQLMFVPFLW